MERGRVRARVRFSLLVEWSAKTRRDSRFSRVLERNYDGGPLSPRALAIIEEFPWLAIAVFSPPSSIDAFYRSTDGRIRLKIEERISCSLDCPHSG